MSRRSFKSGLVTLLFALTFVHAQVPRERYEVGSYFGIGGDFYISFISDDVITTPAPSIQVGAEVAPQVEVRGSFATLLVVSVLSADALYTDNFTNPALRYYVGGGPDLALAIVSLGPESPLLNPLLSVHVTGGTEYRTSQRVGLYAEGQPFLVFGAGVTPGVRIRGGVNFHY